MEDPNGISPIEPLQLAARELGLELPADNTARLRQLLVEHIRELIHADFQKLVQILYRMDVSEKKLRKELEENPGSDAGEIIATLVIERQAQKIKTRRAMNQRDENIDEEDKW
jgi:hypothetical protein